MLTTEECNSFLDSLVRRKVILDLIHVVVHRGVSPNIGDSSACRASSPLSWEDGEEQWGRWCEHVTCKISTSPEEKHNILAAEFRRLRGSGAISFADFMPLTPLFVLARSLATLRFGNLSAEYRVASIELALAYSSKGVYERAGKILRTVLHGPPIDVEMEVLQKELGALLHLVERDDDCPSSQTEFIRLVPLWLKISQSGNSAIQVVSHRLEECENLNLSATLMLYCFLSAATTAFATLSRLSDGGRQRKHRIKEEIVTKISEAVTLSDLRALKEAAHRGIMETHSFDSRREAAWRFLHSVLRRCEKFLRTHECEDYGALWTFAFVKLRWERECNMVTSRVFVNGFLELCQDPGLDSVLRSISRTEAHLALEGGQPLFAYASDLSDVELPFLRCATTALSLFTESGDNVTAGET